MRKTLDLWLHDADLCGKSLPSIRAENRYDHVVVVVPSRAYG